MGFAMKYLLCAVHKYLITLTKTTVCRKCRKTAENTYGAIEFLLKGGIGLQDTLYRYYLSTFRHKNNITHCYYMFFNAAETLLKPLLKAKKETCFFHH